VKHVRLVDQRSDSRPEISGLLGGFSCSDCEVKGGTKISAQERNHAAIKLEL
jgi:hypothetical protein